MSDFPLAHALVDNVPEEHRLRCEDSAMLRIELRLQTLLEEARAKWALPALNGESFAGYIGSKIAIDEDLEEQLHVRCIPDLWLAYGCWLRNQEAIKLFTRGPLAEALASVGRRTEAKDYDLHHDVGQRMCELLLLGRPNQPALISQYSGRGNLRAWLKVIALRDLQKTLNSQNREQNVGDEPLWDVVSLAQSSEFDYLKPAYRAQFKKAFDQSLFALSMHDRLLLRQHFLDGLSIDRLAALHDVHRATAARWIARIVQCLLESTRGRLQSELSISSDELDSVMRLIESRLDGSIDRALHVPREFI